MLRYRQKSAIAHEDSLAVKCDDRMAIDKKTAVDPKKIIRHQLLHQKKGIRNAKSQIPAYNTGVDIISLNVKNICR